MKLSTRNQKILKVKERFPFKVVGVEDSLIRRVFLSDIQIENAGSESIFEFTDKILVNDVYIGGQLFKPNPTLEIKEPTEQK